MSDPPERTEAYWAEEPHTAEPHPESIGPYRVLDVLGEGGMGVVYRAEQSSPVRREVALKILKLGMDTREVVARFESERQALAVMEHPSIAQVYDAGATETGRPYFVMELVRGEPLREYCDSNRLTVRQRVELFISICNAVQHAHQKGVIHRDLKPSNILVADADGRPLPKVIDFGIAKATERRLGDRTLVTQLDTTVGTPAYMSPEQAGVEGTDVDTRTDVYSLGVMLYELLTGSLPFSPDSYRGWVGLASVLQRDPPTLSHRLAQLAATQHTVAELRRTEVPQLRRQLAGDLDWIVLKAIERDRERRYQTVNALAVELGRFLADEPIEARPPSAAYRLSKFAKRNPLGVGLGGALALTVVAFATAQTIQRNVIERQRDEVAAARDVADARRAQAQGVLAFMLDDLRPQLDSIGRLDILDRVGDQALAYFATLPEEEFSDEDLLSYSQALYQIGDVRLDQGNLPEAQKALQESLRLARELSERHPEDTERLFALGQSEFWVGSLAYRRRQLDTALSHYEAYRAISQQLVRLDSTNLDWRLEVGYGHTNVGHIWYQRGDPRRAAEEYARSLEAKEYVVRVHPENPSWRYSLAQSHYHLGLALDNLGRYDEAIAHFQEDIRIKEALLRERPDNTTWKNSLAVSRYLLGHLLYATGHPESAMTQVESSLRDVRALVSHDPQNTGWRHSLAMRLSWIGSAHADLGNPDEAARFLGDAQEILDDLHRTAPEHVVWQKDRLFVRARTASGHLSRGRAEDALRLSREVVAGLDELHARDPEDAAVREALAHALLIHGGAWRAMQVSDSATLALERGVEVLTQSSQATTRRQELDVLVRMLAELGRVEEAELQAKRLLSWGYRDLDFLAFLERVGLRGDAEHASIDGRSNNGKETS